MLKTIVLVVAILISSIVNAESILVSENVIEELDPGNYEYDTVEIKRNGTLLIAGSSKILVKNLISEDGSRIEYKKGAQPNNPHKHLEFTALDGSNMRGTFFFIGDGEDGEDGEHGSHGAHGKNGVTKGVWEIEDLLITKTKIWKIKSYPPKPGKNGENGTNGNNGEDAMSLEVYINNLHPDAYVGLSANGGNGGVGGNGGNGGTGGKGRTLESGKYGGNGSVGGNGGNGGDGGDVYASIIYADSYTSEQKDRLLEFLSNNIHTLPGIPGRGGLGGNGGTSGSGGKGGTLIRINIAGEDIIHATGGKGGGGHAGAVGQDGFPGSVGRANSELLSQTEWLEKKRSIIRKLFKD